MPRKFNFLTPLILGDITLGIDCTSKLPVPHLVEKANRRTAWEFLRHILDAVPCYVRAVLNDNGIQFAEQPGNRNTIIACPMRFNMICETNSIDHQPNKPTRPCTIGQVERRYRTIMDATVKPFKCDIQDELAPTSRTSSQRTTSSDAS
ncbi:MAG: hypothetical protein AB8G77_18100 [Rhodothermales bacterium]